MNLKSFCRFMAFVLVLVMAIQLIPSYAVEELKQTFSSVSEDAVQIDGLSYFRMSQVTDLFFHPQQQCLSSVNPKNNNVDVTSIGAVLTGIFHQKLYMEIYPRTEENDFYYGKILNIDDDYICFSRLDTKGKRNGFGLMNISHISHIAIGTRYGSYIESLSLSNNCEEECVTEDFMKNGTDAIIEQVLEKIKSENKICRIILSTGELYLCRLLENLWIQEYDSYGNPINTRLIKKSDIQEVSWDSKDEEVISILQKFWD